MTKNAVWVRGLIYVAIAAIVPVDAALRSGEKLYWTAVALSVLVALRAYLDESPAKVAKTSELSNMDSSEGEGHDGIENSTERG